MSPLIGALTSLLGADSVLTSTGIEPRYLTDWSRTKGGSPCAVVLPRSTEEVAAVLKLCHAAGQSVVPQGGMTGLAGGAVPSDRDICLSLERMRGIEEIDVSAAAMTVLAGTTLQAAQDAASGAGFELALDLGSRGSCQIGGVLATNAGGIRVIEYGSAREQVLGLEAVLADGTILNSMHKVLKNNTGYDLKQLFIGSEGTLGIVTRAVLRLRAKPRWRATALCALRDYDRLLALLRELRGALGNSLSAFEAMWEDFFDFGVSVSTSKRSLFAQRYPLYALVEHHGEVGEIFTDALSMASDAVVASSASEAQSLWRIREAPADFPARLDPVNYDISLPIGRIGDFTDECRRTFESHWPGHRTFFFGHIADSNLHITVDRNSLPGASDEALDRALYGLVQNYAGSISAEHGIGLLKRDYLHYSRTEAELATMRAIKKALDPRGILNPGKVLKAF